MYQRLNFRADIYSKSVATSASGQKKPTWTIESVAQRCDLISRFTVDRVLPTTVEADQLYLFFPAGTIIDYSKRVRNITDRFGNVIFAGPFDVIQITKETGFTGKLRHYKVSLRDTVEL